MKRLGLIMLAVVVLLILGFWLSVGRDPSGPSGDAEACARLIEQIQPTLTALNATERDDPNYNDAVINYRTKLASAAGSEWPNVDDADLKATLQRIASAPATESLAGDGAALRTLCSKA